VLKTIICVLVIIGFFGFVGYIFPSKIFFECNGKLMSTSENNNMRSKNVQGEDQDLLEIYQIFEMLVFGTKNKASKVDDSKIIVIKNYFFGIKQSINEYDWSSCQNNDVSINCKYNFEAISFNMIQNKLTTDTFKDFEHTENLKFGIYNCAKATNSILN